MKRHLAFILAACIAGPLACVGATFTVSNLDDSGAGSLRQAISDVNSNPGPHTVSINATGTVLLALGRLDISNSVDVVGPGPQLLELNSDRMSGLFGVVSPGVTASFAGLTLRDGFGSGGGGAVAVENGDDSTVSFTNCVFTGNSSGESNGGAVSARGISFSGTLTFVSCTFTDNFAGANGGAIDSPGASIRLLRCTLAGNYASAAGGAISVGTGDVLIENCTLSGNETSGDGGGINSNFGATCDIRCSTVVSNLAANTGGGVRTISFNPTFLFNTIVAFNLATNSGGGGEEVSGAISSLGYNLITDTNGASGFATNDLIGLDPLLGPLQANGGPTFSHELRAGSPAINAGGNPGAPATDQRGLPRIVAAAMDIGAFEVQAIPPTITCPPDLIVSNAMGLCSASVTFATNATGSPDPTVTCAPPSGSNFPVGTNGVTCLASNEAGSAMCSFTITVLDREQPVISCDSNRVVECGTPWSFDLPTATDNCDGTNLNIIVVGTVTNQLVGQTYRATRTWRASDSQTNSAECSQSVMIVDTTPPAIVCSTNLTAECAGPTGTPVVFGATAGDLCDTNVLVICQPASGTAFSLGTHAVNCFAADESGNSNQCSFTVTVRDTTPPVITCATNVIAAENPRESGSAVVTFGIPAASDICDASVPAQCAPPPGSTFPVGFTTVTCVALDGSGNTNACAFTVRVIPYRLSVTMVTTTSDSGPGSFRQALLDANDGPGENLVIFNLPAGPQTIHLLSALPVITSPAIVDGWSQPGFNGTPLIELDGSGAGGADGLVITVGNTTVRGLILNGFATALRLESGGTNVIQGNYIGVDLSGTNSIGNSADGIFISSARNLIGDSSPQSGNVIAGNGGSGIHLLGTSAARNLIQGNTIGAGRDGATPLGNAFHGILLGPGVFRTFIGGLTNGSGNVIAFNTGSGIALEPGAAFGNAIAGNPIFDNRGLGIDLNADGVTSNDPDDTDTGPNGLQNFPILTDARSVEGITEIDGSLTGSTAGVFRVDFFLNDVTDPSGNGEGRFFVGSAMVALNGSSSENFSASFPLSATVSQWISATATDPLGNSSEFSPPIPVRTPPVLETVPISTNAAPGSPVSFCVTVSGTPPFTYQWRRNGESIPGATNSCFTISAVAAADSGSYSVAVGNELGAVGTAEAQLAPITPLAPSADKFAERTDLGGALTGAVAGSNRGATFGVGEPNHAGKPGGKSVWYRWRAPVTGIMTVGTTGSTFDTLLAVYTGDSVSNLVARGSDEDGGGFFTSALRFNAIKGVEYEIAVDGFGGAEGEFVLTWNETRASHLLPVFLSHPQSQTVAPGSAVMFRAVGVRVCGNGHIDCPNVDHYPADELPDLDYQWVFNGQPIPGATTPTLTITNVQEENVGDYALQVSTGWQTVQSDPATLQINQTGFEVQQVQSRNKYLEAVYSGAAFRLGNPQPSGGELAPASLARGYTGTHVFSTARSTSEGELFCGVISGPSEWLPFLAEETGTVVLKINTNNAVMAVFTNALNDVSIKLVVACTNRTPSELNVRVRAGVTNFIAVARINGASGSVPLSFSLLTSSAMRPVGLSRQGAYQLQVTGHAGMRFAIQRSTNLLNWTSILTTNSVGSLFEFTDPGSIDLPRHYYRAQMLP